MGKRKVNKQRRKLHEQTLARYRSSGVEYVRVNSLNDIHVCASCRALQGRKFKLADVPELPYEQCTCELGCRCFLSPA